MTGVTDDANDPRLRHGVDDEPAEQADTYLVLSKAERAKGFIRPVRRTYKHNTPECQAVTTMGQELAETYAAVPGFYGATFCCGCRMHRPVTEFTWMVNGVDTRIVVGT